MPFIASNGLTEAGTNKTIAVGGMPGGMNVHYHDVGEGGPVLFLHSYGPGTTAWITFQFNETAKKQPANLLFFRSPNPFWVEDFAGELRCPSLIHSDRNGIM